MEKEQGQWPVKILLAHPNAPFMDEDEISIVADCALLSNEGFSEEFNDGQPTLVGCPMLENPEKLENKLRLIAEESDAELNVYSMEVPCCHALHKMTEEVKDEDTESNHYLVRVESGEVEDYTGKVDKSMIQKEKEAHGGA